MPNFLTREQVTAIVEGMTARDVIGIVPEDGAGLKGTELAMAAFEAAAERQGHGAGALDRVKAADAVLLATMIRDTLDVSGPKADAGESSPNSAASGMSPRKRS